MLKEHGIKDAPALVRTSIKKTTVDATPARLSSLAAHMEIPIRFLARTIMRPMFNSGHKMIEYEHLDKSLTELAGLMDKNSLVAIVTSHTSHSDILVAIKLVEATRSRFPDIGNVYIPIAASLALGKQGLISQLLYSEGTLPLLAQQNIKPLPLITENDQEKRGMKPDRNELRRLHHAAREENSAFIDFAEGSVEGGRYDILGHEKGMQRVTNSFLPYVFQKAHESGRKVIVLSVGISGTNGMISAESILPTWRCVGALIQDWTLNRTLNRPSMLAKAFVGHPYEYKPNESGITLMSDPQEINDRVMSNIAPLKPMRERGYYDSATRQYQQDMKDYEKLLGQWHRRLLRYGILPRPRDLNNLVEEYSKIPNC